MGPAALVLLVTVAQSAALTSQSTPATGSGSVEGHVVLGGRPAIGVTVTLGITSRPDLAAVTDARGRYAVRGVPPGEYFVKPVLPGHAIAGDVEYQRLRIVDGDPPHELNFALVPAGAIHGRVTDAAGTPIEKAAVYLVKLTTRDAMMPGRVIPVARTDEGGHYRFTEVQPGRYRILAKPYFDPMVAPDARDPRSNTECYHPSGTAPSAARVLTVTAEHALTGADVRCGASVRGFAATGRLVDAASGSPVPNAALIYGALDASGAASVLSGSNLRTDEGGHFRITGLAPGRYWVGLLNSASRYGFGRPLFFEIGTADVQGLSVPVARGVEVAGQVVVSGAATSPGRLTVVFEPGQIAMDATPRGDRINVAFSKMASVGADGRFVLEDVPPGPGRIRLGLDGSKYAVRVRQNGLDVPRGEVVAAPGAGAIDILASPGSGTIRGFLRSDAGRFNSTGVEVVAFLQEEGASFSRRAAIEPDGRFVLDDLPPGAYRVMAIARSSTGTERRIGQVVPVHVDAGSTADIEIDLRQR